MCFVYDFRIDRIGRSRTSDISNIKITHGQSDSARKLLLINIYVL